MFVNRFTDPEYVEAVEHENAIRDAAFIDMPARVCGIDLRQMTPVDYLLHDGLGFPLHAKADEPFTSREIVAFLWLQSVRYKHGATFRAMVFGRMCRRLPLEQADAAIKRFIADTFQDAPGSKVGTNKAPQVGFLAGIVDVLAAEYGWAERDILRTPLKRLFQFFRCIKLRNNPKAVLFNASDKVISRRLRELNQKPANQ